MADVHSHLKWSNDGVAAGWGTKTNATFIAHKKLEHRGRNEFVCSSVTSSLAIIKRPLRFWTPL